MVENLLLVLLYGQTIWFLSPKKKKKKKKKTIWFRSFLGTDRYYIINCFLHVKERKLGAH
jgi:hypothetical protein